MKELAVNVFFAQAEHVVSFPLEAAEKLQTLRNMVYSSAADHSGCVDH
jgi:hypothetical protein